MIEMIKSLLTGEVKTNRFFTLPSCILLSLIFAERFFDINELFSSIRNLIPEQIIDISLLALYSSLVIICALWILLLFGVLLQLVCENIKTRKKSLHLGYRLANIPIYDIISTMDITIFTAFFSYWLDSAETTKHIGSIFYCFSNKFLGFFVILFWIISFLLWLSCRIKNYLLIKE